MNKVRITVMRKALYKDLMDKYENPIEHACNLNEGDIFISDGRKPDGLCNSAWYTLEPYVKCLVHLIGDFYEGWMKDKYSAMISCNDGFRPVSFYIEIIKE